MSTTTAIQLDPDEIEALRDAAFWAMQTAEGPYGFDPARPADNAKIPEVITRTVAMSNSFKFYAAVLTAAEAGQIGGEVVRDRDARDVLVFFLQAGRGSLVERLEDCRVNDENPERHEPTIAAYGRLLDRHLRIRQGRAVRLRGGDDATP